MEPVQAAFGRSLPHVQQTEERMSTATEGHPGFRVGLWLWGLGFRV